MTKKSCAEARATRQAAELTAKIDSDTNELRVEYGAAFEQNIAVAKKAAERYGLDSEWQLKFQQAFGPKALVKHLVALGEGMGEHKFVSGQSAGAVPQEAKPSSSCPKHPSLPTQMGQGFLAEAPRQAASADTCSSEPPN
jgi:hypothetical protein